MIPFVNKASPCGVTAFSLGKLWSNESTQNVCDISAWQYNQQKSVTMKTFIKNIETLEKVVQLHRHWFLKTHSLRCFFFFPSVVKCPIISNLGEVIATGNTEEASYGDAIHFECESPNKMLQGLEDIHCKENGQWSGIIPTCTGNSKYFMRGRVFPQYNFCVSLG